jgi:uncharacterized membrane protein
MKNKPDKEILDRWHSDPSNWKWGVFYYNKQDPRIFPPKRNPSLGWTVNFGNTKSIFVFVLLTIGLIVVSSLLSRR